VTDAAQIRSIPGVLDATILRGPRADREATPDLIIEVPHGATKTHDFEVLEAQLSSPLPKDLVDFFHVNTDAGAPELAEGVARRFLEAEPTRIAAILCCRIPRTFIDCNRNIEVPPDAFLSGKMTPGLMPWITTPEDRQRLRALYDSYVREVRSAIDLLGSTGAALLLHSYAPRTIDVEVDLAIVESLHRAYQPDVEPTWPLRPSVDVIGRDAEGRSHAPAAVVDALKAELARVRIDVGDSATYPLHPSTLAFGHVMARPERTLCIEVRRDLLADPFTPFAEMRIAEDKVDRIAGPIAAAIRRWW
jgi:predicted N-formylglutamate amidohydrolase